MTAMKVVKPCFFVGSSRRDLSAMPAEVKDSVGFALFEAQTGREAENVKALKGFSGRGVLEILEDHDGDTYRAVYTVRFSTAIYVLHVFQKKSKSGIATPKHEIELIKSRLATAEGHYRKQMHKGE
jgi:phage-related protein